MAATEFHIHDIPMDNAVQISNEMNWAIRAPDQAVNDGPMGLKLWELTQRLRADGSITNAELKWLVQRIWRDTDPPGQFKVSDE